MICAENPSDEGWEKVVDKETITIFKKQLPGNPCVLVRAESLVTSCDVGEIFDQIYYEKLRQTWD